MVYYNADLVEMTGKASEYTRTADSGDDVTHGFCPNCGSPFYLKTAKHPGGIGIAVGMIEGSEDMEPLRSVFEENRHHWVEMPGATERFPRGRDS